VPANEKFEKFAKKLISRQFVAKQGDALPGTLNLKTEALLVA
jgi:hypothetical protein